MGLIAKVKLMLGIGTVSVKISGPTTFNVNEDKISGQITITGKSDQVIESVELEFREEYSTGSGDNKTTKNFTLGQTKFPGFAIKKDEVKNIAFDLPVSYSKSRNEEMAGKGGIVGGVGKLGSFMNSEKSKFELIATADVKGAKLDPNDILEVKKAK